MYLSRVIPVIAILLTLYETITGFDELKEKPFENNVGKEENAGNQQYFSFSLDK